MALNTIFLLSLATLHSALICMVMLGVARTAKSIGRPDLSRCVKMLSNVKSYFRSPLKLTKSIRFHSDECLLAQSDRTHFGPLRKFALSNSNPKNHEEVASNIRRYIAWRNELHHQATKRTAISEKR